MQQQFEHIDPHAGADGATGHLDPDEARRRLVSAGATRLASPHDRRVHGYATMAVGAVVGLYIAAQEALDGVAVWDDVTTGGYVVLLLGLAAWQSRAARTIPRNARTTGRVGLAATVVLTFVAIFVMNAWGHTVPVAAGWLVLVAVGVAAPMLVAGWLIVRGDSR